MEKGRIARLAVQGVALAFGLWGLYWVYMGLDTEIRGMRGGGLRGMLPIASVFLAIGATLAAIAWRNIRSFGPSSIRDLAGIVAFTAWICMSALLSPIQNVARDAGMDFDRSLISLAPVLLSFVLYRVLGRALVRMAVLESPLRSASAAGEGRSKAK